ARGQLLACAKAVIPHFQRSARFEAARENHEQVRYGDDSPPENGKHTSLHEWLSRASSTRDHLRPGSERRTAPGEQGGGLKRGNADGAAGGSRSGVSLWRIPPEHELGGRRQAV